MNQAENIYDQIEALKRRVSLLEDWAELDMQPEPAPEGFADWVKEKWQQNHFSELSNLDVAGAAWIACAASLKAKHDAELMRAFVQGSNWEYDRAGSEDPSERAKGMLAAGTLGKS